MDTYDQAALQLAAVKVEYEHNPRLRMDYGDACARGRVWREDAIITPSNTKIEALGSGMKVRGRRHGPYRPDLVILDDIENDENVRSPEQRDKLENWVDKAVMQLGSADGSLDVILSGTILHYDGVLARKLKNPLWRHQRHKSIIQMPSDMALWDRWEEILLNEGIKAADLFYRANRNAMNKGAVVSWPAARPLVKLMTIRARDGHAAFDSEHQNDPINSEEATFSNIRFWVEDCARWVFAGAVDPSLGKSGKGRDPSAILVGGFDRQTGVLDVIEARIKKRLPSLLIAEVIDLQRQFGCHIWGFETVQFQEFLRQQLVDESIKAGVPVPTAPLIPNTDKLLRIESLEPYVRDGKIRLHSSQTTLLSQMRHWPKADHDDGPDALQMLWHVVSTRLASRGGIRIPQRIKRRAVAPGYLA
ncbi:MAG: phage terminase large subunit [Gammaproteobacteria bacterium]|nr:phage terminase large subunit [Gammaproteobacteria bacterium]